MQKWKWLDYSFLQLMTICLPEPPAPFMKDTQSKRERESTRGRVKKKQKGKRETYQKQKPKDFLLRCKLLANKSWTNKSNKTPGEVKEIKERKKD